MRSQSSMEARRSDDDGSNNTPCVRLPDIKSFSALIDGDPSAANRHCPSNSSSRLWSLAGNVDCVPTSRIGRLDHTKFSAVVFHEGITRGAVPGSATDTCPRSADFVAKVFLGCRTGILRTADAFSVQRREGTISFHPKSITDLRSGVEKRHSGREAQLWRAFLGCSIFDFCNRICQ
jgi:hypothetical protein